MNQNVFIILKSIPSIGPVWATGILSEIGDIKAFHSSDALAKYASFTWLKNDSSDFISEDSRISKAGNTYLRYYFGEAANGVRRYVPEYAEFCFGFTGQKPTVHRRKAGHQIKYQV